MTLMTQERYWTTQEIAETFRVSEEAVRKLIRSKQLKAIRFGGVYRISQESLDAYLNRQDKQQSK